MSISYNFFGLSNLLYISISFLSQIALYIRQRQLEKQRADGIMVITYNRDGVTISRRSPDQPSCHKLWKHNRTVVSPKASLLSFLLSMHIVLLNGFIFSNLGPSGPTIYGQLFNFLSFCILFFLYSFIEAIFSPTLRSSLLDVFTCYRRRRAYHVVNV